MTTETIELLKNWDASKMVFPAFGEQKYDGVPIIITRYGDGVKGLVTMTRQGEVVTSVQHILEEASQLLVNPRSFVVGEVWHPDLPFKDISGKVRDTKKQSPELSLMVFDGCLGNGFKDYGHRIYDIDVELYEDKYSAIKSIQKKFLLNATEVDTYYAEFMRSNPTAEGVVIHSSSKLWSPGKRCWGTQRIKPIPTIDLLCIGFEEAHSDTGEPLGMVGRCLYDARRAGRQPSKGGDAFGPGALAHSERRLLWEHFKDGSYVPRVCEVRYMKDETYKGLRQGTFLRWRDDKSR